MNGKQLRNSILQWAISGRLVPQCPNDEPAIELLKRINPKAAPITEDVPFTLPDSWCWCRLEEIGNIVTGSTPPKSIKEYYNGDIPFFKPADLESGVNVCKSEDHVSELGFKQSRQLPPNSILVTCIGATIGKTGLTTVAGTCNQQINAIVPNNVVLPLYVYFACVSDCMQTKIKTNASATTLPILNKGNFARLPFPLPPLAEQERIVRKVEELLPLVERYDKAQTELDRLNASLKGKLRASVLQEAISGRLVPQDPNDEPASALLKRINPKATPITEEVPFSIPNSWVWCKVGDISNVCSARRVHQKDWRQKGVPFYRAREIGKLADSGHVDNELFIDKELYDALSQSGVPQAGDLMITAVGTLGKVYIVQHDDLFYYKDASVICLQNKYSLNSQFLKLVIDSPSFIAQYALESQGTTVATLTMERFNKYLIPLPPLAEQERIVGKVEELFAVLDALQ